MRVTDLQYYMEDKLIEKVDLMIDQCTSKKVKGDALLLIEGDPGAGKTGMSVNIAKYFAHKTGRKFDNTNVYFDVAELIKKAQSTENGIFIWDEPALTGLSSNWWNTTQKELVQLMMLVRKKRHFFIFNITKFTKFNEYIIVDRPIGMIHVYKRNQVQPGRFVYYKKNSLEKLYYNWRKTRVKSYKLYYDFRGSFPWKLPEIIDEVEYEQRKDDAILSIGTSARIDRKDEVNIILKYKIASLPDVGVEKKAKFFEVDRATMWKWSQYPIKFPHIDFKSSTPATRRKDATLPVTSL